MYESEGQNNVAYVHVNTLPAVGDSSMCCDQMTLVS